jgi:hypothetical protein
VTYPYVIDQSAFQAILACAPKERRLLLDAFSRLAEAPFQEPDMKDLVEGREVLIRFIGPFAITYWLDHAVKEIRIVQIFRN